MRTLFFCFLAFYPFFNNNEWLSAAFVHKSFYFFFIFIFFFTSSNQLLTTPQLKVSHKFRNLTQPSNHSHTKNQNPKTPPYKPISRSNISISKGRKTTSRSSYAVTPKISTLGIDVYMSSHDLQASNATRMHSTLDAILHQSTNKTSSTRRAPEKPDPCTPCSWPTAFRAPGDARQYCTVPFCSVEYAGGEIRFLAHPGPRKTLATAWQLTKYVAS